MREEFGGFVAELCNSAAKVIMPYYLADEIGLVEKSDATPVTIADREAEAVMRELIKRRFPSHGIIGEEHGNENEGADWVWTLDPIDGTVSFVAGAPLFGTLVGLLHLGKPVLGAINLPVLQKLILGDGERTTIDGKPIRLREIDKLSEATMLATDVQHVEDPEFRTSFNRFLDEVNLFRTWGDCFGYALLAMGRADIMMDPRVKAWDILPLIPIVRGAGGTISAWDGSDAWAGATTCLAAHPSIHAEIVRILTTKTN